MYTASQIGIKEITSLFLYGTPTKPQNIATDSLARPVGLKMVIDMDAVSFMRDGAGRFANGSQIEAVNAFMKGRIFAVPKGTAKTFSLQDVMQQLGAGSIQSHLLQSSYMDGTDDHAMRTYVYQSGSFRIADGAQFVVNADGSREIRNFAILPFDDNFDFESSSTITQIGNLSLEAKIDPTGIGRRVNIDFDPSSKAAVLRRTYAAQDYLNDVATEARTYHPVDGLSRLPSEMQSVIDDLWNVSPGVTQILDSSGRVVIHGTDQADTRTSGQLLARALYAPLRTAAEQQGVNLIGGLGNDSLVGGFKGDALTGGRDDDILRGGLGADEYVYATGDGRDVVIDDDGFGSIMVSGNQLKGASKADYKLSGRLGVWTVGGGQFVYTLDEAQKQLVITGTGLGAGTNSITIRNFQIDRQGGYVGITLERPPQTAIKKADAENPFATPEPTIAGVAADMAEKGAAALKWFGNFAASVGDTITIAVRSGSAAGLKLVTGSDTVDLASPVTLDLLEGQTESAFAVVGDGTAGDQTVEIVVTYTHADQSVESNVLTLTVRDGAESTSTFNGDFVKKVQDDKYVVGDDGNYIPDGDQPGALDLITGTSAPDVIRGLGGDDALLGRDGDDTIEGGDGTDILMGGLGADVIVGGAGGDVIYGSSSGELAYPGGPDYALGPNPYPYLFGEGLSWRSGAYGPDSDGFLEGYLTLTVSRDEQFGDAGNSIDAGDGDDYVYAGTGSDHVDAGAGIDQIMGMGGDDVLLGGADRDRIYGDGPSIDGTVVYTPADQHGADFLDGGEGNDLLLGQGGNDAVFGGVGDDELWGDDRDDVYTPVAVHGADYLDGEDGNDIIWGGGAVDEIYGGLGADRLYGDDFAIAASLHGNDYLDGEEGDDQLVGNGGKDDLFGGSGNDVLFGDDLTLPAETHGADYLDGEDGDDQLVGDGGDDQLFGGLGNDILFGDDDTIDVAVHGNDYLDGEDGDDDLYGQGGNDTLWGGTGIDTLRGGAGNDALYGEADGDILGGMEGDDILDGGDGNDELQGGDGEDVLLGSDGDDRLFGEAGNDYLDGGLGADLLLGEDGDDELFGAEGNDLIVGGAGVDYADGESGDDELQGGDGEDVLFGSDGADRLYGGADADFLAGEGDADQLVGDEGDDILLGGTGNDLMQGGSGDDSLEGEEDNDQLQGGDGNDYLSGGDGADHLFGDAGADLLLGDDGDDQLGGGADSDSLLAGRGNDALWGDAGNDLLDAGDGDDYVEGGDGDDTLVGGTGFDRLYGGAGNDTYVFAAGDTANDPSLAEFVNDVEGVNTLQLDGFSIGTMNLTPYMGFGGNDFMLETGQGTIFIRGMTTGSIGTVNVSGVTYTAGQFFGKTYAWSADQSTTTSGATLQGGRAGDTLTTTGGSGTLAGGLGNDTLNGSGGNNTYVYEAGDGSDVINDTSSGSLKGTLRFGAGITADQLKLSYSGSRLVITFGPELAGSVEITGFDPNNAGTSGGIGSYQFSDGTVLTQAQLVARGFDLAGSSSSETVTGTNVQDRITGGAGDDTLIGKGGADTYTFNAGDGSDTIADGDPTAGTGDILRFGEGITTASVNALRNGNDVIFVTGSDQLTLRNYFTGGAEAVERILFADGTEWTQADVNAVITASASTDFNLVGTDGNNTLRGLGGNDTLDGRGGDDTLTGATGNDTLIGGSGYDTLFGGAGSDTYIVRPGFDGETIDENGSGDATGVDVVRFEGINRQDAVITRSGDALYVYARSGPYFQAVVNGQFGTEDPANRVERIEFADGTVLTAEQLKAEVLKSTEGSDYLTGFAGSDVIDGRWGADQIMGQGGNDTLQGSQGNDTLYGDAGDDVLAGGADNDYLFGGDGNDTMEGGAGRDHMDGGAGNDTYSFGVGQGMEIIQADASGIDQVLLKAGITPANVTLHRVSSPPSSGITFSGDSLVIQLNGGNDQLWIENYFATGSAGYVETIKFADGTTWDYAYVSSPTHLATLGGTANTMTGTTRSNTFTVDHWQDVITDPEPNDGDLISSTVSYGIPNTAVWDMTLTGGLNLFAVGNTGSNTIRGNSGDNWFTLSGAISYPDTLYGGRGDDTYLLLPDASNVDTDAPLTPSGSIVELAGEGNDTLITGVWSLQLQDNVENLILGTPNSFSGTLYYNSGATSNYTHRYLGNAANNVINTVDYEAQAAGQGWAQYRNYPGFVGMLDFVLDGGLGADTLIGGRWNDTYVVDNAGDLVIETGFWSDGTDNSPNDTVQTPFETSLLTQYAYVENVTLTGSAAVNATGNAGNNRLDGSQNSAANVLTGGDGNDTYVVGVGDIVVETGTGVDTFMAGSGPAGTTFSFAGLATIENGRVNRGAGALNLEGNGLANVLNGNGSNNTIWGGDGDDTIEDQFLPDILYTGKNGVTETKPASDFDLLVGGSGNDTITSRGGNDTMDGGAGDDRMTAVYATARTITLRFGNGYGHDVFAADMGQAIDIDMGTVSLRDVTLQRQNGLFTVRTADGSVLDIPTSHFINSIRFAGGIVVGSGQIDAVIASPDRSVATQGADFLVGSSGADTIDALGGFDAVYGLEGADSLLGGTGNDSLFGGVGNDTLDGGLADASGNGQDVLAGGAGADVYRFGRGYGKDEADDLVINTQGEIAADDGAFDLVQFDASVATTDVKVLRQVRGITASGLVVQIAPTGDALTMQNAYATGNAGQIEAVRFNDGTQWDLATLKTKIAGESGYDNSNDTLTAPVASSFLDGRGGNDTLTGGTGADTLVGGLGDDSMTGGAGNDTYYVDSAGDQVIESAKSGSVDTVISSYYTYTLGTLVENLTLEENTPAFEAIGNTLNNVLTGNSRANTLSGGGGVDTFVGGLGDDTYYVDSTTDVVTEFAGGGNDTIETTVTLASLANEVENVRLAGTSNLNATGNALNNVLQGNAGVNSLVGGLGNDTFLGGAGADTLRGDAGDDYYQVDAADVVVETAGGGFDTVEVAFNYTLAAAADVERLVLQTGAGGLTVTGNAIGNQIVSNTGGNDTLNGGVGVDWLFGGAGADTLQDTSGNTLADGGADADTVTLGTGNDFVAAGLGNDSFVLGGGSDVIGFQRGDGVDVVQIPVAGAGAGERNDTISVGSVMLSELALSRTGNDLQLRVIGTTSELRLAGWYAASANQTIAKLQVVIDSSADYAPGSGDTLRNSRITTLNFDQLVAAFDAAYAANSAIGTWQLSDSVLTSAFAGSSNTQLLGGEVAYQYAHGANLSGLSFASVQPQVSSTSFGSAAQDILNPVATASMQMMSFSSMMALSAEPMSLDASTTALLTSEEASVAGRSSVSATETIATPVSLQLTASAIDAQPTGMGGITPVASPAVQPGLPSIGQVTTEADDAFLPSDGSALTSGGQAPVAGAGAAASQEPTLEEFLAALAALDGQDSSALDTAGAAVAEVPTQRAPELDPVNVDVASIPDSAPVAEAPTSPAPAASLDAAGSDALIAWMRAEAEAATPASSDTPQALQQLWEQVDAWAALEEALTPAGGMTELGLAPTLSLSERQLAFGGTSRTEVTAALGSASRLEQVAQFQVPPAL
ncbi:MAG TPA: calcium-binding protein [Ramlibacter sp.]|uniref:calcium-binding protein n=1 Tax=Ramlibacter sp. TaxID=1917967 RepID=UPI002ED4C3BA